MTTDLDTAKYISFTTFKRDGTPVRTPVWVVPFEGGYAFTTEDTSFKVKRVRNNPAASATVCSIRGAVQPGATEYAGTAEVLDETTSQRVKAAVQKKYFIAYKVLIAPAGLWRAVRRKPAEVPCAIKFTVAA